MIKELTLELKRDYTVIKRQIKYILLITFIGIPLIIYNSNFLKLEENIVSLKKEKVYLQANKIKLKSEVAKLSSPERIAKIAQKKLNMKKVDLHNVVFIESK